MRDGGSGAGLASDRITLMILAGSGHRQICKVIQINAIREKQRGGMTGKKTVANNSLGTNGKTKFNTVSNDERQAETGKYTEFP